jgi:hypothetical protein
MAPPITVDLMASSFAAKIFLADKNNKEMRWRKRSYGTAG